MNTNPSTLVEKPLLRRKEEILQALETTGWWLAKNQNVRDQSTEDIGKDLVEICKMIGVPVSHDNQDTLVWSIKPTPHSSGKVITYSEHNHEADLHTDSQYSDYPEDYFALLTLQKACCGGGMSYILRLEDILAELRSTPDGKQAEDLLRNTKYPFIVPQVFMKEPESDTPEIVFGPILEQDEIRFRVDTVEKALEVNPKLCTDRQLWAFQYLVKLVRSTNRTKKFFLEDGDLVIINNKTTLHGRSSFTDANRHLLRVRMNKYSL